MISQQSQVSVAEVRVNFLKSVDSMAQHNSKAWNRVNRFGEVRIVADCLDGLNLNLNFEDQGSVDVTDIVKGLTVNVRMDAETWEDLNARFHEMENAVGARIEFIVDGDVVWNTLTVKGEQRESYTLYLKEVHAVEEVKVQRLSSKLATFEAFKAAASKEKTLKEEASQAARAQSAAARQSVEGATEKREVTFG